jgi:hypothetical protein
MQKRVGVRLGGDYRCKKQGGVAKRLKTPYFSCMTDNDTKSATPRWRMCLFLVIFISSAAWGGCALAEQAGKKGTMKSKDPIEDRSLFGR